MRLLDRYVLGIFIPALAMFTLTLLFLFIAVDFAAKLSKFLELRDLSLIKFVATFYAVRIPMLLVILLPSVLLFAPTFTVIKLARANEILPIAASGISLRRLSLPFLAAACLGSLGMAAIDEFILPRVAMRSPRPRTCCRTGTCGTTSRITTARPSCSPASSCRTPSASSATSASRS